MMKTLSTKNYDYNQNFSFANMITKDILKESFFKPSLTISAAEIFPLDLMDISVDIMDHEIITKIMQDLQFRKILVNVINKIKKYFHKKEKWYEIKILIWRDAEVEDWTENMIKVKAAYQNADDRMRIWWDIQNLLTEKEKKTITVLLED